LVAGGDVLRIEKESENQFDKSAVKLFKNDLFLGYVKLKHSTIFYKSGGNIQVNVHHIEKNGVLKRVFIRIAIL